ncbi:hypothetical protein Micbo1qcDRAFT_208001 [Microdochium bolleyi]|uniref:Uncharacterized protein n=1 Tax=Microdochium bolleyi TaxID=196109 RepID=A0A136ISM2_9PEZI|nr:hypothetical protein Micbo1qcDRAFT_208001 [Microdochium bolleyi]
MTSYTCSDQDLEALGGKTILIIGAVTGIGRAAVELCIANGANVAIGDVDEAGGQALASSIGERALFQRCDVSNWAHVLELFEAAHSRWGVINAAISNAGVNTHEGLFDHRLDGDDKTSGNGMLLPPDLRSIDINLIGQIHVAHCATYYFAKWPEVPSQIVMTSSAGAFFPAPPIYMYCTAKAGIVGLMRSMRSEVIKKNISVNVVAPWLTVTPMVLEDWLAKWTLPKNDPEGVARALLLPVIRPEINGKSFFVAGNEITELEDSLYATEPQWMGQELAANVREGQDILLGRKQI